MSEEIEEVSSSGKPKNEANKTRNPNGTMKPGFNPQTEGLPISGQANQGQSQPKTSDYTKMNAMLAKNLGLQGKFADLTMEYTPEELFRQLSFMNDNTNRQGGLPENQPIAPISPQPNKYELPGEQLKKPNLSKDNFSVSFKINPKDLLQPKKKQ